MLEKRTFALRTDFSVADLEGGLTRAEDLNRRPDGTDGSHSLTADFKARRGGQGERSGGRGGRSGGGRRSDSGRGKRDVEGRPPQQDHL